MALTGRRSIAEIDATVLWRERGRGGKESYALSSGGSISRMAQHKIAILLHDEFEMWRPPPWFVEKLRADFPRLKLNIQRRSAMTQQALAWR